MMKSLNSTRVKAPDSTNPSSLPLDPQRINDAAAPNPNGKFDAPPRAGLTPSQSPIGRTTADAPKEKVALLTTKIDIGIGTWNVRTLYQPGNLEILLNQMQKLKWEILGISETHWTDSGEFSTDGYKILCAGNDSIHRGGVALILNKQAQNALLGYNPISTRMISARFQTKTGAITVIQVYAPNTSDSENFADEFYDLLQVHVNKTPKSDILLIMGDLNAKVGEDNSQWETVMGKYRIGNINGRGEKLLTFCATNDLCLTNTMFKQSKFNRQWTWESPDQRTHNKIDYIIISNKWKRCVTNSRSFPSADVGSDHQLVMANMKLKFKTKTKPNHPKRYEVFKLKNETTRRKYEIEIGGRFAPLLNDEETDANTLWEGIKSAINDTSKDLLGYKKPKKPKPWISAEVIKLSEERSKVKLLKKTDSSKKGKYNFLTREIKRKTKGCKDKWMKELCANVDKAHQAAKSKEVYATIKKITSKPTTRMQTVKSKEGEVLTELQEVKNRWKENYEELYTSVTIKILSIKK